MRSATAFMFAYDVKSTKARPRLTSRMRATSSAARSTKRGDDGSGMPPRHVQDGLLRVVEGRGQQQLVRGLEAEPRLQVVEPAVHGQGGRGEHGRAHLVEQQLLAAARTRRWAWRAGRRRGRASRRSRRARRPRRASTKREVLGQTLCRARPATTSGVGAARAGRGAPCAAPRSRSSIAAACSATRGDIQPCARRCPRPWATVLKKLSARWRTASSSACTSRASRRAALSSRSTSRQRSSTRCDETWIAEVLRGHVLEQVGLVEDHACRSRGSPRRSFRPSPRGRRRAGGG